MDSPLVSAVQHYPHEVHKQTSCVAGILVISSKVRQPACIRDLFHSCASPRLWNQLPVSFRQPCTKHSADDVTLSNSPPICSPLSLSLIHSLFYPGSKLTSSTNIFNYSLLAPAWTAFSDYSWTGLTLLNGFSFLVIFLCFYFWVVR